MIYYPTLTSVLAWLSARYTLVFLTSAFPNRITLVIPAAEGGCVVGPECMALALFFLCAAYATNALSPKIAGHFQVATTIIKLIPLLLMAVVGIIVGLVSDQGVLFCKRAKLLQYVFLDFSFGRGHTVAQFFCKLLILFHCFFFSELHLYLRLC